MCINGRTKQLANKIRHSMTTQNEHDRAGLNPVRGTVGVQLNPEHGKKQPQRLGVNDTRVWEKRLRKRVYVMGGKQCEAAEWSLRLKENGRVVWFPLDTSNKGDAAQLARKIGLYARANGLRAAEAEFKKPEDTSVRITVGEWICGVQTSGMLSPKTMLGYATALRQVAAGIMHAKGDDTRYDYKTGGAGKWQERLDTCRLDRFTPDSLARWQRDRVADSGNSPEAQTAAKRTSNSYIRQARALFSPKLAKKAGMTLPDPLPFAGVELLPEGSMRYTSRVNIGTLVAAAGAELRDAGRIEEWKAFLLCLFAGLRRAEVDCLLWKQVDFEKQAVSIQETWAFHPKTATSCGDVPLDPEISDAIKETLAVSSGDFVLAGGEPKPESARPYYRAEATWEALGAWLRDKGIAGHKPLHTLRKEAGSQIATTRGIFAASKFLRHRDIAVTVKHYADNKDRVTVGLGGLLKPRPGGQQEQKEGAA
jgi:integrase